MKGLASRIAGVKNAGGGSMLGAGGLGSARQIVGLMLFAVVRANGNGK